MSTLNRPVDFEPLDRLERKVKLLVDAVGRLTAEKARLTDEQSRLAHDLDAARARVAELEGQTSEIASLKTERETVRARVSELLTELEGLNLG